MSRVIFGIEPAAPRSDTGRADVACCVGLARVLTGATLSGGVMAWLHSLGYSATQVASLTNVPIPIETYAAFTALFDDGSSAKGFGTDYLAAAMRSFFAQGGRKCYLVRVDDPITDTDFAAQKTLKLQSVLGAAQFPGALPEGPLAWSGVAAVAVLEEVSLLMVPDLPILCASAVTGARGQQPVVLSVQEFTPCTPGTVVPQQRRTFQAPAPRLTINDYANPWGTSVATVLNYLGGGVLRHQLHLREIQFVAAFPLPQDVSAAAAAEMPSSSQIAQDIDGVIAAQMPEVVPPPYGVSTDNLSTAQLQLGYPWLKTGGSNLLLEQLESPDGALAGLIARNALTRGAFTSATKIVPADVYDVSPLLPLRETQSSATALTWGIAGGAAKPLIERLSLFGMTATGVRLLSDVTAYPGELYRSGAVNRLWSVILRAARTMCESLVFESNGPALWGRVQRFLQNLMTRLWTLNALDGATVAEAFSVRCDQSTMTANDRDGGRLIALLTFNPAATLETIRVQLDLGTGGTSAAQIAASQDAAGATLGNAAPGMLGASG
jgi:hypothetical protein